jgi:murein L,D-transpeptidase YafK
MKTKIYLFLLIIISALSSCKGNVGVITGCTRVKDDSIHKKTVWVNKGVPLKRIIDSLKIDTDSIKVLIIKSDYELSLWYGKTKLKNYPVVLGFNPVDDKRREGDGCTPEGFFHIKDKYPHRSWSKFIWISYPTSDSYKKHNEAKQKGDIPKSAKIGGDIGIHGVPEGCDNYIDDMENWTLGCISLKTADINEIYDIFSKKTVIEIRK